MQVRLSFKVVLLEDYTYSSGEVIAESFLKLLTGIVFIISNGQGYKYYCFAKNLYKSIFSYHFAHLVWLKIYSEFSKKKKNEIHSRKIATYHYIYYGSHWYPQIISD